MTRHIHITKNASLIAAPASKSFAQRALFAAALNSSPSTIMNLGTSDDVLYIKGIVEQLGFQITEREGLTIVQKIHETTFNHVNVGESGLGARLTVPILSHFSSRYTIDGHGTLLKRPMKWFQDFLPAMGLAIRLNGKFLPLEASGTIRAGHYKVDGSESSQYISGLLMTLVLCSEDSILEVINPTSTPYIDITLSVLADFGIKVSCQNYTTYQIRGNQKYQLKKSPFVIEGDFSGAAFWITYGLLTSGISISNLNPQSVQADKAILEVVKQVGGHFKWKGDTLLIIPPKKLSPFNFDATNCPDLFPVLVVLGAGILGNSSIIGVNRLITKESNRKMVLLEEFSKLGLEMRLSGEQLHIHGTGSLSSGIIDPHNDHRIAMAAAIASTLTASGIHIQNSECVNKSYPEFWAAAQSF